MTRISADFELRQSASSHIIFRLGMTALPPRDEATKLLSEGSVPLGLYATLLLPAEEAAIKAANDSNVIYARIVGYLLLNPLHDTNRCILSSEILDSCEGKARDKQHDAVYAIGKTYFRHLIRVCESLSSLL